jgi:probable F420-dependent oxidoreductase
MSLRIGVSTIGAAARDWPDRCRRIESLGFDEISVADHLVDGCLPPMAALAAAATVTERVSISTMVLNNELRHPAVLANEAAMVAELAHGRLRLGIGAGYAREEHDAIGTSLPPPATRVERLAESVAIVRRLLAGETVSTDGPHFRLEGHRVAPVPSHPVPLLVGGGSRSVLRVAAEHADIVGFTGFSHVAGRTKLTHFSAAGLADRTAFVRRVAGDRWPDLALQALVQVVTFTDDRESAAARIVAEIDGLGVEDALESPFLLLGTADEIADQLRERADRYGISTWTTFSGRHVDPPLEAVAEVVAALRT